MDIGVMVRDVLAIKPVELLSGVTVLTGIFRLSALKILLSSGRRKT